MAPLRILHNPEHQTLVNTHFESRVTQWREVYEQAGVEGAIYRKRLELVLRWIDKLSLSVGEKVLEIGCGGGSCTVALAKRGYLVEAMDSIGGMLNSTQQRAAEAGVSSSVTTSLGDAHNLAFQNSSFAFVLAIGVLPYLQAPEEALREMSRVLRPGGFLLVTAGNRWSLGNILDPWLCPLVQPARRIVRWILRRRRSPRPDSFGVPMRRDSLRKLNEWLSCAGLTMIQATTVGFPPLTVRFRPIFEEQTSVRLNYWLQKRVDSNVPGLRSCGMDYMLLARKQK
jgi:2-polyprenyl-3-methyl-5-hydroxy-6-metoxy-1,4-benzoquinol methylase